jgi:hypothetical protein
MDITRDRNVFDLSYEVKGSGDMGYLIPIFVKDVLPGDTALINDRVLVRFTPIKTPIMHSVHARIYYFFEPCRLDMDDWEDFIGGGEAGTDTTTAPYIGVTNASTGTLWDYFGLPTGVANELEVSAFPFRAYARIWNEHFRNQNYQTALTINTGNGDDTTTNTALKRINWERDYFTDAMDTLQRGSEETVSIGTTADVDIPADGQHSTGLYSGGTWYGLKNDNAGGGVTTDNGTASNEYLQWKGQSSADQSIDGTADLTSATGVTLSDLRDAILTQRFKEINMRAGVRYTELLKGQFGVVSSDARLDRPELLGADEVPIIISEVLQNSKTDGTDYLGTMGGHGIGADYCNGTKERRKGAYLVNKTFEEHGWIIGLMAVVPRTHYSEGIERMWDRADRYDYAFPVFAGLSDQAIKMQEIYADGTATDDTTFGYAPRYQEYRESFSKTVGDFRSTFDHWHMDRQLGSTPTLNSTFIECTPREDCFQAPTAHTFFYHIRHDAKFIRKLPKIGKPASLVGSI